MKNLYITANTPDTIEGEALTLDERESWLWHQGAMQAIGGTEESCEKWANEKIMEARHG